MSGVLCGRRIKGKVKGNVYKIVARPAMVYGAGTWPVGKAQDRQLDVETKMVGWMCVE